MIVSREAAAATNVRRGLVCQHGLNFYAVILDRSRADVPIPEGNGGRVTVDSNYREDFDCKKAA